MTGEEPDSVPDDLTEACNRAVLGRLRLQIVGRHQFWIEASCRACGSMAMVPAPPRAATPAARRLDAFACGHLDHDGTMGG